MKLYQLHSDINNFFELKRYEGLIPQYTTVESSNLKYVFKSHRFTVDSEERIIINSIQSRSRDEQLPTLICNFQNILDYEQKNNIYKNLAEMGYIIYFSENSYYYHDDQPQKLFDETGIKGWSYNIYAQLLLMDFIKERQIQNVSLITAYGAGCSTLVGTLLSDFPLNTILFADSIMDFEHLVENNLFKYYFSNMKYYSGLYSGTAIADWKASIGQYPELNLLNPIHLLQFIKANQILLLNSNMQLVPNEKIDNSNISVLIHKGDSKEKLINKIVEVMEGTFLTPQ